MSDVPERDLVVAAALLRVRAPEHTDGFWERLEHRLAATELESSRLGALLDAIPFGPPTEPEPVPLPPGSLARLHRSRESWRSRAGVLSAVALLVAVAGAAALLSGGDDDPGGEVAAPTVASTAGFLPSTTVAISSTTVIGAPEAIDAEPSSEITAVEQWVDAVAMGDTERAWDLLGSASRARVGGYDQFAALMPELGEGFGAMADAEDRAGAVLDLTASDEGTVQVITLRGHVRQEGIEADVAKTLPVRQYPRGRYRVEPFANSDGEMVDIQAPEPGPAGRAPMETDGLVEAIVPARADLVLVSVNGGPSLVVSAEQIGSSDLARLTFAPTEDGWDPGVHLLTVAYIAPDGTFGAAAIVLDVTSR